MIRLQIIPRGENKLYRLLRDKIDNEAKTLYWVDSKRRRIGHKQPGYPGRIVVQDANGILAAHTVEHTPRIVGAFVGLLSTWFQDQITAINVQISEDGKPSKKTKKK
jgi:hypothetical protein